MINFLVHSETCAVPELLRAHESLATAESAAASLAKLHPGHAFHPYQKLPGYSAGTALAQVPA